MLIAARNALNAGKQAPITAASYVQTGLIAMWDGIENAGWGTHDPTATTWADLTGNYDATQRKPDLLGTGWDWGDDCYIGIANTGATNSTIGCSVSTAFNTALINAIASHTVQIVFKPEANRRMTIFGQYNAAGGVNYELFTSGRIRTYYNGSPDWYVSCWNTSNFVPKSTTVTCNGTNCSLYINAAYNSQKAQPTADRVKTGNFVLGGEYRRYDMSVTGRLYSVRVYSRVLTAAEMAANHAVDKKRFKLT